jgi:nitrate/nitrite-specific signal transduction histidine kinase
MMANSSKAAASRLAAGDISHPPLDDRAKDEIGALAQSFNIMVGEMNRLSGEYDRLVLTERTQLEGLVSGRTQALEQSREMFRLMAESTNATIVYCRARRWESRRRQRQTLLLHSCQ